MLDSDKIYFVEVNGMTIAEDLDSLHDARLIFNHYKELRNYDGKPLSHISICFQTYYDTNLVCEAFLAEVEDE